MSNDLNNLSEQLADTVAAVAPSLVRILHPRFPGTGIVWSADGHFLTTSRRARRGGPIKVSIGGGEPLEATLVGRDPATDIALWKVDAEGLVPADFDTAERPLRVGEIVLALGHPGSRVRAAFGMVGHVGGTWRTPLGAPVDVYIDVDGSLPPGFAGGALVRADGSVLGLNSRHLVHGGTTVPVATIQRVVAELLEHGEVRTAYLGVGVQPVALPSGVADELGRQRGLLVSAVEDDGPALGAGLLVGDILVALDGQPLVGLDDLILGLARSKAGGEIALQLVRGGDLQTITLNTEARVRAEPKPHGGRGGGRGRRGRGHGHHHHRHHGRGRHGGPLGLDGSPCGGRHR